MLWWPLGATPRTLDVRSRQEDRRLRVSLPRRERARGRPSCSAGDQGAGPARRGRGRRNAGLADCLGGTAFAALDRAVELLPRRTGAVAPQQHWAGLGVRPALAGDRLP